MKLKEAFFLKLFHGMDDLTSQILSIFQASLSGIQVELYESDGKIIIVCDYIPVTIDPHPCEKKKILLNSSFIEIFGKRV